MLARIRGFSRKPFIRNVATVATGTVAAQAIAIAFSPIITQLYDPDAFGALSVSARRWRIGLYFAMQESNITAEDTGAFLRQVQRALGRKLIVILDRWAVHRRAAKALSGDERFWIE